MITVSFETEEGKNRLITEYSTDYELVETRYLFTGNELKFKKKVNGLTMDEQIAELQQSQIEQDELIMSLLLGGLY